MNMFGSSARASRSIHSRVRACASASPANSTVKPTCPDRIGRGRRAAVARATVPSARVPSNNVRRGGCTAICQIGIVMIAPRRGSKPHIRVPGRYGGRFVLDRAGRASGFGPTARLPRNRPTPGPLARYWPGVAFNVPALHYFAARPTPRRCDVTGDGLLLQRSACRVPGSVIAVLLGLLPSLAGAAPSILVDAASGDVLEQQDAARSWYPASTTKLMTVYVALDAVAAGRISLNTPIIVSPRALSMAPSKMGFRPGTQVTLDNALKMLMVKSANDIAVTIAEGISGSVEGFADEMNSAAAKLGMRESHFVNPNGLPDSQHVSSARDLAILARGLLQRVPDHADLYDIGAMRLGARVFPTHNGLLGRYVGADGMKTGFTCAAGFNIVATATRGGRRLIAVVLGAPSATARTIKAASMFDRGFAGRMSFGGSLAALPSSGVAEAPDMRDDVCRNRSKASAAYLAEIEDTSVPLPAAGLLPRS